MKFFEKKKKSFSFGNKKKIGFYTDNEIGPWFWFPISKPGFGRTLAGSFISNLYLRRAKNRKKSITLSRRNKEMNSNMIVGVAQK